MTQPQLRQRVRLDLPAWVWGNRPEDLIREADLHITNASGVRWVQTGESYRHGPPGLVTARTIAGPGPRPTRYDDLARVQERGTFDRGMGLQSEIDRRVAARASAPTLVSEFYLQKLATFAAPVDELPRQAEAFHKSLMETPLEGRAHIRPFEQAGVQLVEAAASLHYRLRIPSLLLRLEQDPRAREGDLSHIQAATDDGMVFESAAGLYEGIYMLTAYLDPLLLCLTPSVWVVNVPRSFGQLLFSLGQPIAGTNGDPAELLHLISVPGATEADPVPHLSPTASAAAIRWWCSQLNLMFGTLSDPVVFASGEQFAPMKQIETTATVEQLFRRTASTLHAHRDTNARLTLMFSVMDTVQSLTGYSIDKVFELNHAQATLARLTASIPEDAAEVLLHAARRGVAALEAIQQGFFIRRQLRAPTVDVTIDGETIPVEPDRAAAELLRNLRNATHGHGSNVVRVAPRASALLAHHDGRVPHDLGLLAHLYLLDVLANPERLRRVLSRR